MRLTELLKTDQVTISCELFPPKQGAQLANYKNIVADMAALKPAYMSVTYGATGGTSDYTVELASEVEKHQIPALAHLTCASSTKEKVASVIEELKEKQISNILALRGDIPQNADFPLPNQYRHASELIADIKAQGDFCIGGACYPEGHPESKNIVADIENLKRKADAGASQLVTQLFLDNDYFYSFQERVALAGINLPIEAGIMPVTNKKQIERMVKLCGVHLPKKFMRVMDKYENNPEALRDAGIAYAIDQIVDLTAHGADGIHLYTMNNPYVARKIYEAVHSMLKV